MKHKVCINIAKPGGTPTPVVRNMTGGGGYSSAAFVIERSSYAAFKH